jgi:glycosyltransferase involved in cell wall biosynthesis
VVIARDLAPGLVLRLRDLLRQLKPDVVHTHLQHADLYGIPAARMAGVKVVLTSRHNENTFRHKPHIKLVNQRLWRSVNAGIAISESVARFAVEVEQAPPYKIHVVYYGLPQQPQQAAERPLIAAAKRQELGFAEDDLLIGMACRLVEQKGVIYALEAFQQIMARFPKAHLVIAGDGPLRSSLEQAARTAGDRVRFLGWRDDTARVMAAFDLFLMPSLWEGFGLAALEAMAQRVPVIASRVSSLPEIITHGETGLLVPPRDSRALAQALTSLLEDRALRQHMGLLAEDRVETQFGAAQMIDQTLRIYHLLP